MYHLYKPAKTAHKKRGKDVSEKYGIHTAKIMNPTLISNASKHPGRALEHKCNRLLRASQRRLCEKLNDLLKFDLKTVSETAICRINLIFKQSNNPKNQDHKNPPHLSIQ